MRTSSVLLAALILAAVVEFVLMQSADASPPPSLDQLREDREFERKMFATVVGIEALGILANVHRGRTQGSRVARAIFGVVAGTVGISYGLDPTPTSELTAAYGNTCAALGVVTMIMVLRQRAPDRSAPPDKAVIEAGLWQGDQGDVGLAVRLRY